MTRIPIILVLGLTLASESALAASCFGKKQRGFSPSPHPLAYAPLYLSPPTQAPLMRFATRPVAPRAPTQTFSEPAGQLQSVNPFRVRPGN